MHQNNVSIYTIEPIYVSFSCQIGNFLFFFYLSSFKIKIEIYICFFIPFFIKKNIEVIKIICLINVRMLLACYYSLYKNREKQKKKIFPKWPVVIEQTRLRISDETKHEIMKPNINVPFGIFFFFWVYFDKERHLPSYLFVVTLCNILHFFLIIYQYKVSITRNHN